MKPSARERAAAVVGVAHAPPPPWRSERLVERRGCRPEAAVGKWRVVSAPSFPSPAEESGRKLDLPKVVKPSVDSLVRSSTKLERVDAELIGAGATPAPSLRRRGSDAHPSRPDRAGADCRASPRNCARSESRAKSSCSSASMTSGRVDASTMQVLHSEHELFAEAVRAVLPRFRFEPACWERQESKAVADWVEFRTRFAATK